MRVNEVMTRGVECVRPGDNIARAAEQMKHLNVGALPVCGDNDRLVGMITDRDITVRATAGGSDPSGTYVRDVMTPNVVYCFEDQGVEEAARMMKELNVGALPVCGDNDRLVGMITDRDITVRGTAGGCDPSATRVQDVMTPEVLYCFEDDLLSGAARKMEENQIRRLVVLNRDRRLVGIVSLGDLAVKGGEEELSHEALEGVSEPAQPRR
jgi:CBS domain-containing protein